MPMVASKPGFKASDPGRRLGGIAAALFAALVWSLNFAVPFVIGRYTVFDFALVRFGISGLVGAALLATEIGAVRRLAVRDWLVAAWLAFIGYVGYFFTVTGAAIFAGPVIAPAFLGLTPIVLALVGNLHRRSVSWHALSLPLSLIAAGLLFVDAGAFAMPGLASGFHPWIGLPLSIGAVALWSWFAIANEAALAARPEVDAGTWSALTMVAGGLEMLVFLPVGSMAGLFGLVTLGAGWATARTLYVWGASLALAGSVGGVWAWNVAARRLPIALAAQLIVSETVFGVVFGLMVHRRAPTSTEIAGLAALVFGVILAIHVFHRPSNIPGTV